MCFFPLSSFVYEPSILPINVFSISLLQISHFIFAVNSNYYLNVMKDLNIIKYLFLFMANVWAYSMISVVIVSLFSVVGVLFLSMGHKKLQKMIIFMVSFAAGALFGDVFIHLLPELVNNIGFSLEVSLYILLGILLFFVLEKFIHWRHCHVPTSEKHPHPVAFMNLIGDGLHNLIDGMIIAGSYIISIPVGIATTVAVILHEIPQEISDFGVLIYGGFTRMKALLFNFFSAFLSVIGALVVLLIGISFENIAVFLIPFTAGGFIYIAGSDLIPELKKESGFKNSILQLLAFFAGILIMLLLVYI